MIEFLSNFSSDAEILRQYVQYKDYIILGTIFAWLLMIKEAINVFINISKTIYYLIRYGLKKANDLPKKNLIILIMSIIIILLIFTN